MENSGKGLLGPHSFLLLIVAVTAICLLLYGLVDDVDAAVAEFRQKVTDAGLDVCREGFKEQWQAYCEEYNYQ